MNEKQTEVEFYKTRVRKQVSKENEKLRTKYMKEVHVMYDDLKQKFQRMLKWEKQEIFKEHKEKESKMAEKVKRLESENKKLWKYVESRKKKSRPVTYWKQDSDRKPEISFDEETRRQLHKVEYKTKFN